MYQIAVSNVSKKYVKELTAAELTSLSQYFEKLELDDAGETMAAVDAIKIELDERLNPKE